MRSSTPASRPPIASIADSQVADAVVVDVVAGLEQVNGATEVEDQLDLLGAVALGERDEAFWPGPTGRR
jgi:hypothetical protein